MSVRIVRSGSAALAAVAFASFSMSARAGEYAVAVFAPPAAHAFASPLDMNAQGLVTLYAGSSAADPATHSFLLDPGQHSPNSGQGSFRSFHEPQSYYNFVFGAPEAGRAVGRSGQQAWAWEQGTPIPLAPVAGFFSCTAYDVNEVGRIVGSVGDSDASGPHPCIWLSPSMPATILSPLIAGAENGSAHAINAASQVAGAVGETSASFHAVRWDHPALPPLQIGPLPGAISGQGLALNDRGDVVGSCAFRDDRVEAFLFVDAIQQLIGLGFLGDARSSEARSVNARRQVVGTARVAPGVAHAFVWERGTMRDLNELVAFAPAELHHLSAAAVIDDEGRIVAEAVLRDGRTGIAVLRPLP